jgi:hypothetical protein
MVLLLLNDFLVGHFQIYLSGLFHNFATYLDLDEPSKLQSLENPPCLLSRFKLVPLSLKQLIEQ